jgi:cell wall-associated NlpC family hydrolase
METQRAAVVAEARTWIGTDFHHESRVKRAGVDCAGLLAAVYHNVGLIPDLKLAHYPSDWFLHRDGERFLNHVLEFATEVEPPPKRIPLPGDVVVWKFGRCFSHGAIVEQWPAVIHAHVGKQVTLEDTSQATWLTTIGEKVPDQGKPRPMRVFVYKGWV